MQSKLLTTREVAEVVGCRVLQLNRLIQLGHLKPTYTIRGRGGRLFFSVEQVKKLGRFFDSYWAYQKVRREVLPI